MTLPIPIIIITYIRLYWLKSVGFPKSIFFLGDMVLEIFFFKFVDDDLIK